MRVKRIVANVKVADPKEAQRFYGELLGLETLMDMGWIATYGSTAKSQVEVSFMTEGGSVAAVPDLSIKVDNLDEALGRMRAAKIKIVYGPASESWGVRRFFVRDPFGKLVNVLAHES